MTRQCSQKLRHLLENDAEIGKLLQTIQVSGKYLSSEKKVSSVLWSDVIFLLFICNFCKVSTKLKPYIRLDGMQTNRYVFHVSSYSNSNFFRVTSGSIRKEFSEEIIQWKIMNNENIWENVVSVYKQKKQRCQNINCKCCFAAPF